MALLRTVTALILIQAVFGMSHWSYNENSGDGPTNWKFACHGQSQSPIDITGAKTVSLGPLSLQDYDVEPSSSELKNNGHSVKLTNIYGSGRTPELSGAGLGANYKFGQVHFHWGENSTRGSEHTINGRAYPMEMHLVHFRADFPNISEAAAADAKDSLAVLGIFFEMSSTAHPGLEKLLPQMSEVREVDSAVAVPVFPLSDLVPGDLTEVFRYSGSLTTPPCSQIVEWTVIKKPVDITQQQMDRFRELLTQGNNPLVNNYRPIQSLNSRKVQTSKTVQNLWISTRHPSSSSSSSSSSSLHVTVTLLLFSCVSVVLGNNN